MPRPNPSAIATAVHTYRMSARTVRNLMRHPEPTKRGVARHIDVRDRAMRILDTIAPRPLTDALRHEDVLLELLRSFRRDGLDDRHVRAELAAVRARRRAIMSGYAWRRAAVFYLDVLTANALQRLAAASRARARVERADARTTLTDLCIARLIAAGATPDQLDRNGRITA